MLGVGLAAAAAGAGVAWWRLRPEAPAPLANQAFWDQRFDQPDGSELVLRAFQGRPLLVNFWATWCPPCVEELPMLEAFWREHGPKGLQMVAWFDYEYDKWYWEQHSWFTSEVLYWMPIPEIV